MPTAYKTATAFRQALEQRLKRIASERGIPLNTLRLKVVIERLLARLFSSAAPPWLLKGGYAMELRYRPNARTTSDIDLSVPEDASASDRITRVRDELQEAASRDLGDFFQFRIGEASTELQGAPLGGARFRVEAVVAGRRFGQFHVDVGIGDAVTGEPERLTGDDLLGFAGIAPATAMAVPIAQQFAEKLHALTFPWTDRTNTRSRDLVDLVLFIERESLDPTTVRGAVLRTFDARRKHAVPVEIQAPPPAWAGEFTAMADEAHLKTRDLATAHRRLSEYWARIPRS